MAFTFTSLMRIILTRSTKPFRFQSSYTNSLDFATEEDLGLYVHVPFCRKICSFCPYCKVIYDKNLARQYKEALLKEIELVGSQIQIKKEVTSLYFGGGTPALMVNDLKEIIESLKRYFVINQGIGVELHPSDISASTLAELKNAGVTMISVGVQSFHEQSLSTLGRKTLNYEEKFKLIREANFAVVDVDLIFAIPNQTEEILLNDIETAFFLGATQISTYPFIDFAFAKNQYKPLSEKAKKKMLKSISRYCQETGRVRTAIWTFAKLGTERYSSITRDSFLGFGVSATTLLKEQFKINTFSLDAYINRLNHNQLPTSLTLEFSRRQRAVYYLFWHAYSMKISLDKFEQFFGISLNKLFGFEFWLCERLGFVKKENEIYYLTEKGAYYFHLIEQKYTNAYIDKMWNISRQIAFPEEIVLK